MKKVLYIGWIGYKNLGDELMYELFREQFQALGNSYHLDSVNIEHKYLKNVSVQDYELIVLGGGSILSGKGYPLHPYIINYLNRCLLLKKKVMIWGSGIDWIPKSSLELLEKNKEIPLFISDEERKKLQRVFEESVWSGVRGPLTLKLLDQVGVKTSKVSGDPGFLLTPLSSKTPGKNSLSGKNRTIGVNWGTSFNNIYGENEERVEDELVKALNELIKKGYQIHLYTVWSLDLPAIRRLYSKLSDPNKVFLDEKLYNHQELLSLMENFTFTINFKLHANYLSLAANTPFIALGYRFKVFDFVKSIDFDSFIISTDYPEISNQILKMEQEILEYYYPIKEKMKSYVQQYRKTIKEPFEHGLFI